MTDIHTILADLTRRFTLPSPSDHSKDSSAVPVDLNGEVQNHSGLELQPPVFDPDLYED